MRGWWWKSPDPISLCVEAAPGDSPPQEPKYRGTYQQLQRYLCERYANRVVLTFAEIEDILGFALPPVARVQRRWWGADDGGTCRTAQSDAWIRASRTASVNLLAQTVLFERQPPISRAGRSAGESG